MMYNDCGNIVLNEYQYKNTQITLKEIIRDNPDFALWYVRAHNDDTKIKRAFQRLLLGHSLIGKHIRLSPETIIMCNEFGLECAGTTRYYEGRGQTDSVKWVDDHSIGKKGEHIAYEVLKKLYGNMVKPDMEIYDIYNKSWRSDMRDGEAGQIFAVKTQAEEATTYYPRSWMFNINDPKVFNESAAFIKCVFVTYSTKKEYGYVSAISNLNTLHEKKLFKHPVTCRFWGEKASIYYKDLVENNLLCDI